MRKYLAGRSKSMGYAIKGLGIMFRTQANARIHFAAAVVAVSAGFYFNISKGEWLAIVISIAMVWMMEAANTAIEYLTDLVSPAHHHLAGKAKDCAAAAVLISAISSLIIAGIILVPKLLEMIK